VGAAAWGGGLMSLAAFQRAMADMAASPALCGRVREDADAALAAYALSDVERRRVASAATQVGMRVNCMLYRSNRLSPLASQLPSTFLVLGGGLRAVADGYWAENPVLERNAPTEVRRFAAFVQRRAAEGAIDEPLVPQVLAWEMVVYELALLPRLRTLADAADAAARAEPGAPLRLHPLVGVATFSVDPRALLPHLYARRRPPYDDVPTGEYHLLADLRGEQRRMVPLDGATAEAMMAVRDGQWIGEDAAAGLIAQGLVVPHPLAPHPLAQARTLSRERERV
jgi:hypothetical protein